MNTQAIAQHLNLAQGLILEVQEWASVLWVRIKGMRPKFVSKKAKMEKTEKTIDALALALLDAGFTKASVWQKHGLTRIYTQSGFVDLTNEPKIKGAHSKEEKQIIQNCLKLWNEGVNPTPKPDWKQHLFQPQPQANTNVHYRNHEQKEWYFGAADEESF